MQGWTRASSLHLNPVGWQHPLTPWCSLNPVPRGRPEPHLPKGGLAHAHLSRRPHSTGSAMVGGFLFLPENLGSQGLQSLCRTGAQETQTWAQKWGCPGNSPGQGRLWADCWWEGPGAGQPWERLGGPPGAPHKAGVALGPRQDFLPPPERMKAMPHLPLSEAAAAKSDQAVTVSSPGESEPGRDPGPEGSGGVWPVWAEGGVSEGTRAPPPLQTGTAEAWVCAWEDISGREPL